MKQNVSSVVVGSFVKCDRLLTRDEETSLAQRIENGDRQARDMMIRSNLRLAVSIAKKYSKRGVDFEDLLQESSIGLMKAVDRFDWRKGFKFSTYAYWWIKQAVRQYVANNSGSISLPANSYNKLYKANKFSAEHKKRFGSTPTSAELADFLGTTEDTLSSLRKSAAYTVSIDAPMFSDGDGSRTLADCIPDESPTVDDILDQHRMSQTIGKALNSLTARERAVICLRFGLDPNDI